MRGALGSLAVTLFALGCASSGTTMRFRPDTGPEDGSVLEDAGPPECTSGDTELCTTSCGTTGVRVCSAAHWMPCEGPAEDCNATDDDCDGNVDEDVAPRACSSGCGGGSESCAAGSWTGCTATTPMPETCNAIDDDCDSRVDEMLTRSCSSACGSGTETCMGGLYLGCTAPSPRPETCSGMDDDCDGVIDDGVTRACSTACGSGVETCTAGMFAGCTAPPVGTEICNGVDDDCNGVIDDGFQIAPYASVPWSELTAAQPACTSAASGLDVCLTAAKRWCVARTGGCTFRGGAGLLASSGSTASIVCVGSRGVEVATNFTEVAARTGITLSGANIATRVAHSAANRFCRAAATGGYEAGIGPIEHSDPQMWVTCLPSSIATYLPIPTSDLVARGCDPISNANALACAVAADAICRARGDEAGWGPVEWNTTDSAIVCMRD